MLHYNNMPLDDHLTAKEAAKRLHVHEETVKRHIRAGELPAFKLGNTWLIRPEVLDSFAATYDRRRGPKPKLL